MSQTTGLGYLSTALSAFGTGFSAAGQNRAGNQAFFLGQLNAASIERATEASIHLAETNLEENVALLLWNARMADRQAEDAVRRGAEEEHKFRLAIRGLIGEQRASFAGQGVELGGDGTPADIFADSAYWGEIDALTIRTNAAREAWGFRVDAEAERRFARSLERTGRAEIESIRAEGAGAAASARLQGTFDRSAGRFNAASTILTGSANMLFTRYGFNR